MSGEFNTVVRAQGRWREILPHFGIDPGFLRNRHGPCPLCGGRDRYRFDDKDGSGSYYCNQCGAGNGMTMIRKLRSWDFKTACEAVDAIIGTDDPELRRRPCETSNRKHETNRAKIERLFEGADRPEIVVDYLTGRGLSCVPSILMGHPALAYVDDGQYRGRLPAVIAPIIGPDDKLKSATRIYVADVPVRKKMMPVISTISGAAVRLFEAAETMGVAEGIETAIAAHELFDVPVWAALSTSGLESFRPPVAVRHLRIFGDNDRNYAGQKAAFTLGQRISADQKTDIETDVSIPPDRDTDWLDVFNKGASGE